MTVLNAISICSCIVQNSSEDSSELCRVMNERDELQVMLNKFERHMSEVSRWPEC